MPNTEKSMGKMCLLLELKFFTVFFGGTFGIKVPFTSLDYRTALTSEQL